MSSSTTNLVTATAVANGATIPDYGSIKTRQQAS